MASGGIDYKNNVTKSISKVMKDCGRSEFSQNEQAYSTSNISMKNSEAIMNYILGNSTYSNGRAVVDYVWSNYVNAMHDAGLNPIPRSVPLKPADFSWLDIRM